MIDNASALSQQWKTRENKVFSQKAQEHAKTMQNMTGTPKIDPMSRKVAEIITRREMESLGISPIPMQKPQTTSAKHLARPKPKKNRLFPSSQIPITVTQAPMVKIIPSKPESNLTFPVVAAVPDSALRPFQNLEIKITGADPLEDLEINKKKPKNHDEDLMKNVENIKAFQDELNREYPELGLNNSIEGSSFHTNELNELEEACKELNPDQPILTSLETLPIEENKELDKLSNKSVDGCSENNNDWAKKLNKKTASMGQIPSENDLKKNDISGIGFATKSKIEGSIMKSHMHNTQSLIEFPSKDFSNLQSSFMKASFLHAAQERVPRSIPRCHVNLINSVSSPLYFSVKVDPDYKVKCENGLGHADSLRRLLLKKEDDGGNKNPPDFYDKNLKWLKNKNDRLEDIREQKKDDDILDCTFDPFYLKHKEIQKKPRKSVDVQPYIFAQQSKILTEFAPVIPENLILYSALSPASSNVKYEAGCKLQRVLERAKPMVNYSSLNSLDRGTQDVQPGRSVSKK